MKFDEDIVLIAGPTASGKTALALSIAEKSGGVILNADSMQVYSELKILSARPGKEDEARCPHYLFGHVPVSEPYSVARWLDDIAPLIDRFKRQRRQIVVAGGTGLYFTALLGGLSPMPEIKPEIRAKWRVRAKEALHDELTRLDPASAKLFEPGDTQRIIRALEVFDTTGVSITEWQKHKGRNLLCDDDSVKKLLLLPPRPMLHQRIETRFGQMVEAGAVEEVQALLALGLSRDLPALKAIGVPQLASYLAGELTLDEAMKRAIAATRQYSKRQSTWFRNTFDADWQVIGD